MNRILVIDDEDILRDAISEALQRKGYEVVGASNGRAGVERFSGEAFHAVITDLKMPEMDGMGVLEEIKRILPETPVILITAHGTIESAVEAIKKGAFDYIIKPFNLDELEILVERALQHRGLSMENEYLRTRVNDSNQQSFVPIGGVMDLLEKAAGTDATVLISGETGTGKEVVARRLHQISRRSQAPFLAVNCAALSAGLLESELFGHEKGAFTGADKQRKGRFELADSGSILLDEVSEIEPRLQAKLLRVLQERCFERVGSSQTRHIDVRVMATTNRDLQQEVSKGTFREDLYYRLNVIPVELPPLRSRSEEIPALVDGFLSRKHFSKSAMRLLLAYNWPGNVRELKNIVERGEVLSMGEEIDSDTISPWLRMPVASTPVTSGNSLEDVERRAIEETLRTTGGNKEKAARILGITSRTLRDRVKKWSQ
jgi:DNA-binding NtrC family response regulator